MQGGFRTSRACDRCGHVSGLAVAAYSAQLFAKIRYREMLAERLVDYELLEVQTGEAGDKLVHEVLFHGSHGSN